MHSYEELLEKYSDDRENKSLLIALLLMRLMGNKPEIVGTDIRLKDLRVYEITKSVKAK